MAGRASCISRKRSPWPIPALVAGLSTPVADRRRRSECSPPAAPSCSSAGTARALFGTDSDAPAWLVPLKDGASADGLPLEAGSVWVARGPTQLAVPEASELLVAYAGAAVRMG